RRPGWLVIRRRVIGETHWIGAVGVHLINLRVAITLGLKSNLAAVWTEDRLPIKRRIISPTHRVRAVGVHHVNLTVAVAIGGKHNLTAIRFIGRAGARSDAVLVVAVSIHHVNTVIPTVATGAAVRGKRDLAAVRAEDRLEI